MWSPASPVWAPVCPLRWPDEVKTVWNLFPEKKQSLWLIRHFQHFPFSQHVKFIFPVVHYFLKSDHQREGHKCVFRISSFLSGHWQQGSGKMFLLGVSRNKSTWMKMNRNHISEPIFRFLTRQRNEIIILLSKHVRQGYGAQACKAS